MPVWLKQSTRLRSAAVAVLSALALVGCDRFSSARVEPPSVDGLIAPRRVVALGTLEPAGGIVAISAVPGEQLLTLATGVQEGATVAAGGELAKMGSFDLRQTQLDAAKAKLDVAKEQRDQKRIAARVQLEQARATLAQAEAKLQETLSQDDQLKSLSEAAAIARDDLAELERLQQSDPDMVTAQQLRRRRNESDRATKEYEAAAATYPHALEAAKKSVEAAKANVRLAEANLQLAQKVDETVAIELEQKAAQESLEQSLLRAPKTGGADAEYTVLRIHMQPGELVTQLPVMEVGDLSHMVCVAEVYEADAKEVFVGQPAVIRSPAFGGQFANGSAGDEGGIKGTVTRIGTMVGSPGLTNRNPLAPSDRSVVEVVVDIDPANERATAEAAKRIGLQVTVEFGDRPESTK